MLSANRNSSSTSVCTLDLACSLLRLKNFPSKRYLIVITLLPSWKAAVGMAETIMLNRVGASTALLDTICHREWIKKLTIILNLCKHTIVKLRHHCYELGRTVKLRHNFPKTLTTDYIKCFGKVNKRHVEVHVPFLAFVLKLPCCEDHVSCSSVLSESTLLYGRSPDCSRCSFSWFSRSLARTFPAIDNKGMPR